MNKQLSMKISVLIWFTILLFVVGLATGWQIGIAFPVGRADASTGYTTVNCTSEDYVYSRSSAYNTWTGLINAGTQTATTGGEVGWQSYNPNGWYANLHREAIRIDLSSIPEGADIVNMSLFTYGHRSNNLNWSDDYFSVVLHHIAGAAPTANIGEDTWPKSHKAMLTGPQRWSDLPSTSGWTEWPILTYRYDDLLTKQSGNYTWVMLYDLWDWYNMSPTWTSQDVLHYYTTNSAYNPYLQVTYASPADSRDTGPNTPGTPFTGDVADNSTMDDIIWETPRAAYSDETVGFKLEGDPGIQFVISLLDSTGYVIDQASGSIWTEGYYWYYPTVPTTDTGIWVRCLATWINTTSNVTGQLNSTWGRIEPYPSDTERLLETYATSDIFPQYDNTFKSYIVYRDNTMWLYWKTNVALADLDDYYLRIMAGGQTEVFNESLAWLNAYVYQTTDTDEYYKAQWRYLAMCPYIARSGFDTKNGFIINAGKDYLTDNTGFWDFQIVDASGDPITFCHSAYYYLNSDTQGVYEALDRANYAPGADVIATVTVGAHSKVAAYLPDLIVTILTDTGEIISTSGSFITVGANTITFVAPVATGNYQARFTFGNQGGGAGEIVYDYEYVHDLNFTVNGGTTTTTTPGGTTTTPGTPGLGCGFTPGGTNILDWLDDLSTTYHWLILISLCIFFTAAFGIFGKMPLVATVLDLLTTGFFLYKEWIDKWTIVLLAIGAGFIIYRIVINGIKGGGSKDGE